MVRKMNDIDNAKLIEAMQAYIKEPGKETLIRLVLELKDTEVFVPVMIHPQKRSIQPYVIKNNDGDTYVPAFTSMEKFPTGQKYQAMQRLKYKQCVTMLLDSASPVHGIVLNPYTDNLMLKEQMLELSRKVEEDEPKMKVAKMKADDFRMITRHNVEFRQIPGKLFSEKMEFIHKISGELLCEMYKEPYIEIKQEALFAYTPADFEILELDIRDDLNIMQIMLPGKYLYKTNCREMYIIWNPQTERIGCYVIEKGAEPEGKRFLLDEVKQDGSWDNLEDAPAEGNVMNRVMDLFEAVQGA